jgi:hypothetical protein
MRSAAGVGRPHGFVISSRSRRLIPQRQPGAVAPSMTCGNFGLIGNLMTAVNTWKYRGRAGEGDLTE